jgi:hypothetical protein
VNRAKYVSLTMLFFMMSLGMLYAQTPAGLNRPASVPSDYVITPFGYFHPSCVGQVKNGETVLADGRIRFADGTEETSAASCAFPRYAPTGELVAEGQTSAGPSLITWSWIESGQVATKTSWGKVTATWTVPPTPKTNDGQTLFFFPALTHTTQLPPNEEPIIQPVLGWNDGQQGAGPWNIASWDCCPQGMTWSSTPVTVQPGDEILGTVTTTCKAGTQGCETWKITTKDVTTGKSTTLVTTFSQSMDFPWAQSGVLEVYSISQCSDFPPNGSIKYSNVALYDYNLKKITNPGWTPKYFVKKGSTDPWCKYHATTTPTTATLDY